MMCLRKHPPADHECAPSQDSLRRIGRQRQRSSGMALLLVLGALVLLSVMILAFLSTVNTERIASGSQLKQTEARNLADSVIGLVTAQIREGTSQTNTLWITQPGAIRTFTSTGGDCTVYKLYSAAEMIVSAKSSNSLIADVPTTGGTLNGNIYTDLNAPVTNKAGGGWLYPILNPAATNVVEGFSVASSASTVSSNTISGAPAQIPMPVRWLYFLRNGDLQPMDVSSGVVANATSNNPIVGRVAFWTDDETCKLNINTASSGMYWDQPIGRGNQFEMGNFASGAANNLPVVTQTGLASSPPGVREFQRYPGHPAMTSLDVVFNNTNFFASSVSTTDRVKKILELSPRYAWGGSQLGTNFPVNPSGNVTLDKDRLYATVDELFYTTNRTANSTAGSNAVATPAMNLSSTNLSLVRFFLTANSRAPEVTAFNTPRVTIWPVSSTATNRTVLDRTIAFCSTIAGTNNIPREYIFQRSAFDPSRINFVPNSSFTGASGNGSQNATLDFTASNSTIYTYLQGLMAKSYPGFGARLASKFGSDSDQILTEIYDYIRCVNLFDCSATNALQYTGRPFYRMELQILHPATGMLFLEASLQSGLPLPRDPSAYDIPEFQMAPSAYSGQVVPAVITSTNGSYTRGFGRFPTIVGATLGFFATDPVTPKTPSYWATNFVTTPIQTLPVSVSNNNAGLTNLTSGWTNWTNNAEQAGKIRGILLFSVATPAAGPLNITHTYDIRVNSGLSSFQVNGASANMTDGSINRILGLPPFTVEGSGLPLWDILLTGGPVTNARTATLRSYDITRAGSRKSISPTGANVNSYPFVSQSDITVNTDTSSIIGPALNFTGGTLDVDILVDSQVVQNLKMEFPNFTAPMPLWAPVATFITTAGTTNANLIDGKNVSITANTVTISGGNWELQTATATVNPTNGIWPTNWTTTTSTNAVVNWRNRISTGIVGEESPLRWNVSGAVNSGPVPLPTCLMPNNLDTVRGIELNTSAAPYGDARLVAGLTNVPASYFQPCAGAGYTNINLNQVHSLRLHPLATNGSLVADVAANSAISASQYYGLPSTMTAATRSDGGPGDWDEGVARYNRSGQGVTEAGAFINKSTDAAYLFRDKDRKPSLPYFKVSGMIVSTDNSFTPNRMMPSAGMFGSLPVGVKRGLPWQTLLFRPGNQTTGGHPGTNSPPDHLMLDLFQMPVVEPYAISDPFSTAGKVNLNWQIAPFSYIKRSTALRGVLYPEKITAVPTRNAYLLTTHWNGAAGDATINYRYNIDRDATMTLFEDRFSTNGVFLTASQICEMPLVPKPENVPNGIDPAPASVNPFQTPLLNATNATTVSTYVNNFWANITQGGAGTADNLRERPYTTIYPRVTVKSNTFQIHMKVQAIQKSPRTAANKMERGDAVVATYQGSSIVERYLDTTQATFNPNDPDAQLGPYRFRVVNSKQFNP